jgi:broad specificity phosphatase PhoE
MKNISVYLVRHGFSEGNAQEDIIGQTGTTNLTDLGIQQARALGKRFAEEKISFDKIFSSTFTRAVQTAKIVQDEIRHKDEIEYSDALIEYSAGKWMGESRSKIMGTPENFRKVAHLGMGFKFPGGESLQQVERRAATYIEDNIIFNKKVLKRAEDNKQNFLIVNHGQTCKAILHWIMGFDQSFLWRIAIGNCSITHLKFNDDGWFLRSLNDTSHLKDIK